MLHALAANLASLSVWLVLLAAVLVPVERIWPVRSQRLLRDSFGRDVVYYFLSGIVPNLVFLLPLSFLAAALHSLGSLPYYTFIAEQPFLVRIAAGLVIGEMGAYWGHRLSHEIPFLWRFHAVHHAAEEMDWLVSSRAHPVDICFVRFCGLLPVYLLGFAQPTSAPLDAVPALITIIGKAWAFFIHANLRWRLGPLEWIVSTPAFHHWHHTNDGPKLVNKNYSSMLPWVDRLFRTYYLPDRWPVKYGVDENVGGTLGDQLGRPFLFGDEPPATTFRR